MARLTDEELERLLRETFADKEKLVDTLPQAIKRRRPLAPVLLAAAAVIVVLGGILYGVNRIRDADPAPPVATAPVTAATDDGDIWGVAIATVARKFEPAGGWQSIHVSGQGTRPQSHPQNYTPPPPVTFSAVDKTRIGQAVASVAQVQWTGSLDESCARGVPDVTVGPIVDKGDHKEVRVSIFYGCGYGYIPTYRIEKVDGSWKVTGMVGAPVGSCPVSGKTPTTAGAGC